MEGEVPPLQEIVRIKNKYKVASSLVISAHIVLDDSAICTLMRRTASVRWARLVAACASTLVRLEGPH